MSKSVLKSPISFWRRRFGRLISKEIGLTSMFGTGVEYVLCLNGGGSGMGDVSNM
jgi:hypothetical protein